MPEKLKISLLGRSWKGGSSRALRVSGCGRCCAAAAAPTAEAAAQAPLESVHPRGVLHLSSEKTVGKSSGICTCWISQLICLELYS